MCCEDYKNKENLDYALEIAAQHGFFYYGLPWVYCPWCGQKLKGD